MSDGIAPVLMPGPLSSLSCRVWQLVSAIMFSGVAIMVSEGRGPGHRQLPAAEGVPQHGSPALIPLLAAAAAFSYEVFALTVSL